MLLFKKKLIQKFKFSLTLLGCCLVLSTSLKAQQSPMMQQQPPQSEGRFKDAELKQFANAAVKVVVIQEETEQKMIQAIEKENLEVKKFNEILTAQQKQQLDQDNISEEDLEKFNKAAAQITKIQTDVQGKMTQVIQEEGLKPQRYEQILLAYQSNPDIKAKVDALIQQ